ncbi:hypothetical protein [Anaerospora hongkongensis]|uniref:hypothetical protein n=1 Tax=Anaerospora hongkongensis TaxID=244830 RepID=UPI00289D2EC7|nr:hypothetical protein [Anaerospora hongkongensis]
MASLISKRPDLLMKLAVTSIGLSLSTAKLLAYQKSLLCDMERDFLYIKNLEAAYESSRSDDEKFSDNFAEVSAEADDILMEMVRRAGHNPR